MDGGELEDIDDDLVDYRKVAQGIFYSWSTLLDLISPSLGGRTLNLFHHHQTTETLVVDQSEPRSSLGLILPGRHSRLLLTIYGRQLGTTKHLF